MEINGFQVPTLYSFQSGTPCTDAIEAIKSNIHFYHQCNSFVAAILNHLYSRL